MKKVLKKVDSQGLYHLCNSKIVDGPNVEMRGNCTRLIGNLDDAGLTDKDREHGMDIEDLVKS